MIEKTLHSIVELTSVRRLTEWNTSFTFFIYEDDALTFIILLLNFIQSACDH